MANKHTLKYKIKDDKLVCTLSLWAPGTLFWSSSDFLWKKVFFTLSRVVKSHYARAVSNKVYIHKERKIIDSLEMEFYLNIDDLDCYSYKGEHIDIDIFIECTIDDSIIFDSTISEEIQYELWLKPNVPTDKVWDIKPKDIFNFRKNFKAVWGTAKVHLIWLMIAWSIVIWINSLIWVHDEFVPENQTIFYSHENSDWESTSPFGSSLASSWGLGAFIWMLIYFQLRKYMKFSFRKTWNIKRRDSVYHLKEILTGKSRVDLHDIEINIVACNMEKWQYTRWSGTKKRTVSFSRPIRTISVCHQKVDFIPKNTEISDYISWTFSFEDMYNMLYPEQINTSKQWLFIHWEVQLIHNDFVDQELKWDSKIFPQEYFLENSHV